MRARLYQLSHRRDNIAGAESAKDKPLFRDSVVKGRCVVPSNGFYEWDSEKRKYPFTLPGSDALYMADLWSFRDGQPCYCILIDHKGQCLHAGGPSKDAAGAATGPGLPLAGGLRCGVGNSPPDAADVGEGVGGRTASAVAMIIRGLFPLNWGTGRRCAFHPGNFWSIMSEEQSKLL